MLTDGARKKLQKPLAGLGQGLSLRESTDRYITKDMNKHVCMCIHVYIYIHMYECVCVCVDICTYVYIHIYIYTVHWLFHLRFIDVYTMQIITLFLNQKQFMYFSRAPF